MKPNLGLFTKWIATPPLAAVKDVIKVRFKYKNYLPRVRVCLLIMFEANLWI